MGFVIAIVALAVGIVLLRRTVAAEGPRPSIARALLVPAGMLGVVFLVVFLIVGALNWYTGGWLWR